jgi:general secretion pathway protein D
MKSTRLSPFLLLLALAIPGHAEDGATPAPATTPSETTPAPAPTASLTFEFRGARLGQVLDYLAKEAGYVIVNPVDLPNPLTLVAKQPLTPIQAVVALNGVLADQGYTAIIRGKTLRVVTLAAARQSNIPVHQGSDPEKIPESDEIVTQVIPVQFATVKDLVENLQPLINTSTGSLSANESSNSLLLTDTQTNIRRIASIIQAIDGSVSGDQQVKVFHLAHAAADKVATVINSVYGNASSQSSNSRNGNTQDPFARMTPPWMNQGGQGGQGNQAAKSATSSRGTTVVAAADTGTNSVVVRASASGMALLSEVVNQLDVDTSSRDNVLVYRVRNGKAADLALSLTNLFSSTTTTTASSSTTQQRNGGANRQTQGATGGGNTVMATPTGGGSSSSNDSLDLSGQVKVVADTTSNSVLVLSPERNFERLRKILTDLDQPMKQVLVRVLVAEVTVEDGLDLGVELQGVNPSGNTTDSRVFSDFNTFESSLGANGYLLNSANFRAAVRALATRSRFDVLSRPSILTTDNKEATVNVSQEVPVITGSRVDSNNNTISTFERQDVGIILTVTPQINSEGLVVLDVSQTLSALTDQSIPVATDVNSPIIKKRTMTTRVAVGRGLTVVVGGLVHDSLTETVRKVPWLGDIPYLGALFRRTERTKSQTELLVFLTPQVVQNSEEMVRLSDQLRSEQQFLDAAVESGMLQRHLDQLAGLGVGKALPAPAAPSATPVEIKP